MSLFFLSPLHRATRRITRHLEPPLAELGVSGPEGHLLTYLAGYGPCPVSELYRVFGHKPSTLTGMLDRLAGLELVTRAPHPDDRRSLLVALTPEGRRRAERITRLLRALERRIRARITRAQLSGFEAVVAAIEAATTDHSGSGRTP